MVKLPAPARDAMLQMRCDFSAISPLVTISHPH